MGYESLDKDTLITLKYALTFFINKVKPVGEQNLQIKKDAIYELDKIKEILR